MNVGLYENVLIEPDLVGQFPCRLVPAGALAHGGDGVPIQVPRMRRRDGNAQLICRTTFEWCLYDGPKTNITRDQVEAFVGLSESDKPARLSRSQAQRRFATGVPATVAAPETGAVDLLEFGRVPPVAQPEASRLGIGRVDLVDRQRAVLATQVNPITGRFVGVSRHTVHHDNASGSRPQLHRGP